MKNRDHSSVKARGYRWWPLLLALLVLPALASFFTSQGGKRMLVSWLITPSTVREFTLPGATDWQPRGLRNYSSNPHPAARPVKFGRALHTDLHGSDEVSLAIAPVFVKDWTAETNMFVAEGPVFDSHGNVYITPLFPPEEILLISLDGDTGKRRWVLPGTELAGAGTPLVLADPESGEDLVYTVTYNRAVATDTDGNILWDVELEGADLAPTDGRRHCFGANYHIQSDSIVAAMGDGRIQVLDRKTGRSRLQQAFVMPGAPTAVTNFTLPDEIAAAADRDIAHMYPEAMTRAGSSAVKGVLHAAAGELQQVTNFFSIDSNSGRIWIASTLTDEADGNVDGWAGLAGLYGLDLTADGEDYNLSIEVVAEVPGGTASTPTISADGKRLYIADAFDSIYALEAQTGERIWSFNVGDKVTGSLNVSADNGEIYANTRTEVKQLLDRGDHAELGWVANLDMYNTGRFQINLKQLGPEIGANGLAFVGGAGVFAGKQKFPLRLGAGLIDRKTGEIRYFVDGAEDSVSSMVTGPDGGLYVGNSPLRRALGRATFGKGSSPQPLVGGVTRFKPVRHDLFLRDVLKAAADRAANAADNVAVDVGSAAADIYQLHQLLQQGHSVAAKGLAEGTVSAGQRAAIEQLMQRANQALLVDGQSLLQCERLLREALELLMEEQS